MDVRSRHRLQTVIHHKCMARANSNAIPTTCAHASMWKYLWPPVTTTSRFTIFSISIIIFFSTFVFAPSSNRHMCVIKATGTKMICIRCYVWHFIWAINDMCASIVCTRKRACVIWQQRTSNYFQKNLVVCYIIKHCVYVRFVLFSYFPEIRLPTDRTHTRCATIDDNARVTYTATFDPIMKTNKKYSCSIVIVRMQYDEWNYVGIMVNVFFDAYIVQQPQHYLV